MQWNLLPYLLRMGATFAFYFSVVSYRCLLFIIPLNKDKSYGVRSTWSQALIEHITGWNLDKAESVISSFTLLNHGENKSMKHVLSMYSYFRLDWNQLYLVVPYGVLKIERITLNNRVSSLSLDSTEASSDSSQCWLIIIMKWWSAFSWNQRVSPVTVGRHRVLRMICSKTTASMRMYVMTGYNVDCIKCPVVTRPL